jgi:hypothetical protein
MTVFARATTTGLSLACLLTGAAFAQTPAFPGAVGFGAVATGGRTGTIYHVTNLNDSGAGSFRDATSASNRIIVFDVGGYVVLQSPVSVVGNLTILGQTAPGGGIGIMGREVSLSNKTNIIMRGVRMRQGTLDPDTGKSALNMGTATSIMLDHCSFAYGVFDSVDAVGTKNVTVSNSIIADPIGQQFGAHVETGPSTFYRNLWVNVHNRQPLAKDNTIYINNIIYDFELGYTTGNTGGFFSHDLINNYFIDGPMTTVPSDAWFQMDANQSVYPSGNYLDSAADGVLNGVVYNTIDSSGIYLNAPWSPVTNTIPALSAPSAFISVVASAGAFPVSDTLSLGLNGTLYKNQALTGLPNNGYGNIAGGTPFTSTSNSGIPDYWANTYGISTSSPTIGTAMYGSTGYTNVEAYANSLILPNSWSAADLTGTPIQGASSYNPFASQWLLTGVGTNASSSITEGQFASQPWVQNGTITAQTGTISGGTKALAGVMVSSPTATGTSYIALVKTGAGGLTFLALDSSTGNVTATQLRRAPANAYLQITQSGNTYTGAYSTDGNTWTSFGSATLALGAQPVAGLIYSSGTETTLGTATFTNVSLTPALQ